MTQATFIKFIICMALIIAGLLAALIGLVVAFIVNPQWLLISLGGLLFIALGVGIILSEIRKFLRFFQQMSDPNTKTRIKR